MMKPIDRSTRLIHKIDVPSDKTVETSEAPVNIKEAIQSRPERKPLNRRDKLKFESRPGYVRRIVNDVEDGMRVQAFKEAGYEIVRTPTKGGDTGAGADSQLGSPVMRSVGGGTMGVLMEIPKKWYDEDQAEKLNQVKETERTLYEKPRQEGLDRGDILIERR